MPHLRYCALPPSTAAPLTFLPNSALGHQGRRPVTVRGVPEVPPYVFRSPESIYGVRFSKFNCFSIVLLIGPLCDYVSLLVAFSSTLVCTALRQRCKESEPLLKCMILLLQMHT